MKLASTVNNTVMDARRNRVVSVAEGKIQQEIVAAMDRDDLSVVVVLTEINVDVDMLKEYISNFGYEVEVVCDERHHGLRISWERPKK